MSKSGMNGVSGYSANNGTYGYGSSDNSKNITNSKRIKAESSPYFDPHNPNAYLVYMNARNEKPQYMGAYNQKPADKNLYIMG